MNREALLQLARVVQDADDERWDMRTFTGRCKCAAGHAFDDPWFKENAPIPTQTGYNTFLDWHRVHKPFGITNGEAWDLFGGNVSISRLPGVSKLAVLANIKRLLEGRPTKEY